MRSLVALRAGFEPASHRIGRPATIGLPSVRGLHMPRHRSALSWHLLTLRPSVSGGAPASLRSSAATGVRRPAGALAAAPTLEGHRFSGLRRVVSRYARHSFPPRSRPWRGGRDPTLCRRATKRANYPSFTYNVLQLERLNSRWVQSIIL